MNIEEEKKVGVAVAASGFGTLQSNNFLGKRSPASHPRTLQKEVVLDLQAKYSRPERVKHLEMCETDS